MSSTFHSYWMKHESTIEWGVHQIQLSIDSTISMTSLSVIRGEGEIYIVSARTYRWLPALEVAFLTASNGFITQHTHADRLADLWTGSWWRGVNALKKILLVKYPTSVSTLFTAGYILWMEKKKRCDQDGREGWLSLAVYYFSFFTVGRPQSRSRKKNY